MSYNKWKNKPTTIDGITFDSKKEAEYYCELKLLKRAGLVKDFEMQVPYQLQPGYKRDGRAVRAITYVADFRITYPDGHVEVVDVKGAKTEVYKIKKKILLYLHPELIFREV